MTCPLKTIRFSGDMLIYLAASTHLNPLETYARQLVSTPLVHQQVKSI